MALKTSQQHLRQSRNLSAFFTNCKLQTIIETDFAGVYRIGISC